MRESSAGEDPGECWEM